MTSQTLEERWERYRDGDMTPAERKAFAAELEAMPAQKAVYDAETYWLDRMLGEQDRAPAVWQRRALTTQIVATWYEKRNRGVLARLHWRAALFSGTWVAALVTIAALLWVNQPAPAPSTQSQMAQAPNFPTPFRPFRKHPFTVLMSDLSTRVPAPAPELHQAFLEAEQWWEELPWPATEVSNETRKPMDRTSP